MALAEFYVGTSGWSYSWNPDGIGWYAENSGLNAVELNASFYRFPFPSMVRGWSRRSGLRWSIKVHRSVTHVRRMRPPGAIDALSRFLERFRPMEEAGIVDFYLFQMPPGFTAGDESWRRITAVAEATGLGTRMAVEWRDPSWFSDEWIRRARELGITVVSIDSPDFLFYARSGDSVYLRMHGRTAWYAHDYSDRELDEVVERLISLGGSRAYVFFNNDHAMLDNARRMKMKLEEIRGRSG
ncbi:MAG: DUF72 domain-containing protein [Conexivisphaera sp.]